MVLGNINSIETMGLVDGPGIRFVVFLQGCRLRCKYCHNPETWSNEKKIEMPKSLQILGFSDDKNPAVPKAHENYVFRREVLRDLLGFLRKPNHDALFITGPTGSGKTSAVLETCARLNWPVQSLTLSSRFEFAQLTGHFTFAAAAVGEAPRDAR